MLNIGNIETLDMFDGEFDGYNFIEVLQSIGFTHIPPSGAYLDAGFGECLVQTVGDGDTKYVYFNETEHEVLVERIDKYGRIVEEILIV